jgi:RsiW-degrading membrane proteinase PrsW (M82 family)
LEGALQDPLVLLFALAFLPALVYLTGLALRHPGKSVHLALPGFFYGATLSLVVLALLYVLLALAVGNPARAFQGFFAERHINEDVQRDFVFIVVLAPVMEELAKGFGVWLFAGRVQTRRDGVLLGASVGLGFAGVETFTYLLAAAGDTSSGFAGASLLGVLVLAGIRSISSAFVHPAATGLTGFGLAKARLRGLPAVAALPFFLLAVVLHATYNYLAGFLPPQAVGGYTVELNLLAALALAGIAWGALKRGVASRA